MKYGKKVLIGADQFLNALLGNWPDETLSSQAWRWHRDGHVACLGQMGGRNCSGSDGGRVDVLTFLTSDGGSTWVGTLAIGGAA